jgi:hypothetical protein
MRRSGSDGGLRTRLRAGAALLLGVAWLNGCAAPAVGLVMLGVAAGTGAGTATSYTLDGIAYKTFTAPEAKVRRATLAALRKMDLKVQAAAPSQNGATPNILATGKDREIEIELERISTQTTRMRVVARDGIFFKDKATATEIIYQVADALEDDRRYSPLRK